MLHQKKFKQGAASFYLVAFSTLILLILATSFAAIMINELTRTSNDDLSQSAYDSALAGIEDAKLAFFNYQNCIKAEGLDSVDCDRIKSIIDNQNNQNDCDMVAKMLGRNDGGEVIIKESSEYDNNMQQAYTCVKIKTSLEDYTATLSSGNPIKVVRAKFDGVNADQIEKVKISWFSDSNGDKYKWNNVDKNKVKFPTITGANGGYATPPTISLTLIQTGDGFNLASFDESNNGETNRGMLYLVPSNSNGTNVIDKNAFVKSNDKTSQNDPYMIKCEENQPYACSVEIALPKPIDGTRSNDTFMFVVALPYGNPTTDFSLEFYCEYNTVCYTTTSTTTNEAGEDITTTAKTNRANLKGVQIEVDSTGRANDLYRRVTTRLEAEDAFALSIMGPLELFGDGQDKEALNKNFYTTEEYNFK